MINGLINVYKEPGYTSFDVVAVLRGILKQKKIGHTGTLDPDAEGVLLVCLGNATKLCDMLEDRTKEYTCRMLLGQETTTEDTSGDILKTSPITSSEDEIVEAIKSFEGDYDQIPPMYSALKVNGKKLYELARQGIEIERKPRPVHLDNILIKSIDLPYVTFSVACSKGTYIRSLCRDIGEKLGCGACMDHLIRTRVSTFGIDESLKIDDIKKISEDDKILENILPVERVFEKLDAIHVKPDAAKYINNGNPLELGDVTFEQVNTEESSYQIPEENQKFRVYNAEEKFVAVYTWKAEKNLFMPEKMFMDNN